MKVTVKPVSVNTPWVLEKGSSVLKYYPFIPTQHAQSLQEFQCFWTYRLFQIIHSKWPVSPEFLWIEKLPLGITRRKKGNKPDHIVWLVCSWKWVMEQCDQQHDLQLVSVPHGLTVRSLWSSSSLCPVLDLINSSAFLQPNLEQ